MANEGAVIVGVDNDERRLDMAMEELNMTGGRAFGRCINALDQAEVDEVVAWAAKQLRHGRHPGERRRRQHDHREARRHGG